MLVFRKAISFLLAPALFLAITPHTQAQSRIAFQTLNTLGGLSYLGVNHTCTDRKGNLWIATENGLNRFNGKTVERYFAADYPQLHNNNIRSVNCDTGNQVWVLTVGGHLSLFDKKRRLHKVALYENNRWIKTGVVLNTATGLWLLTDSGHYRYNPNIPLPADSLTRAHFVREKPAGEDSVRRNWFRHIFPYGENEFLYVTNTRFFRVNYATRQLTGSYPIANCTPLAAWGENGLLYFDRAANETKLFDMATGSIAFPFRNVKDQFGKPITATFLSGKKIAAHQYLFTSYNAGIFIYDTQTGQMVNHTHQVNDPASLSNNTQTAAITGAGGWVFITCNPSGISYFNTNDFIGSQHVFGDDRGNAYDGYIAGIATSDNNTYYIGTAEGLLEWNRRTNRSVFINFPGENGKPLLPKEDVPSIVIDPQQRIWIASLNHGVLVMDKQHRLLQRFRNDGGTARNRLKQQRITNLLLGPDGNIWVSGTGGISRIDIKTYAVDNLPNTALAKLDKIHAAPILFTDADNLWVATDGYGVYHYRFSTNMLEQFSTRNGISDNGIFAVGTDRDKNIYIGSRFGMNILYPDKHVRTLTRKDGLLIDRAEGFLLDKHNRVWIGNDIGLACYNPADSNLVAFDERYGLSIFGFRVNSYFQMPNGEFVFGTPQGIQYFHPDSLFNRKIALNALVDRIDTRNISSGISESETFSLGPNDNQVSFHFSTVEYSQRLRTYYQYQLSGIDENWVPVADQNQARYNALPPGKYVFRVRVSNDNKHWQPADNEVTIIIAKPLYKQTWFKLLGILLGIGIIAFVVNYYRRKQAEKRNNLETELVITYFASQINSHNDIDALLWDVAKNCISKLHFKDCVIYLKDEARNVLVQKAAYGPKNPVDFTIQSPIEIPVGKGITGMVAQTGKAEIIPDTEKDSRYIVDDSRRLSEIAVPMVANNKVIGVIDSEHPQRHFFTQRHLTILQTIAVLCANQVLKSRAEEEKKKTAIELLENRQKAAESRLQSLRLQMNPHFLFNALNSVQQMILANEELVATRYISRFSKLLRAVLVHSDKERIPLKEEIDMLKMYVELESVRFRESFTGSVTCDEAVDDEEVKIPTLLVQPFVENAIWHGLMHKEGERNLAIHFTETDDTLVCTITDNGVGRKRAQEIKSLSGQDKKHTSKGIAVSEERLRTLKNKSGKPGALQINDLYDDAGEPRGTEVIITIPLT